MATDIFLILCGLSVAFLVFVLLQLHKEGRRPQKGAEPDVVFRRQSDPDAIVVTHPISLSAHGGISVLPLRPEVREPEKRNSKNADMADVLEMPSRELSRERRPGRRNSETNVR